jgi:hypothetical protein
MQNYIFFLCFFSIQFNELVEKEKALVDVLGVTAQLDMDKIKIAVSDFVQYNFPTDPYSIMAFKNIYRWSDFEDVSLRFYNWGIIYVRSRQFEESLEKKINIDSIMIEKATKILSETEGIDFNYKTKFNGYFIVLDGEAEDNWSDLKKFFFRRGREFTVLTRYYVLKGLGELKAKNLKTDMLYKKYRGLVIDELKKSGLKNKDKYRLD